VVNISGINLSTHGYSILSKGLNFCPTLPETKKNTLYKELDNFKRNLSLKVFFQNQNEANAEPYRST